MISEGYIWYYIIEKYGNMISPETWTLIGVAVGATLGFIFTLFRDYIQEESQKKTYFGCLLADLKYNKNLAEKGENWGYSLGSMERSKYLLDLSPFSSINSKCLVILLVNFYLSNRPNYDEIDQILRKEVYSCGIYYKRCAYNFEL